MRSADWTGESHTKEVLQEKARRVCQELPEEILAEKPLDYFIIRLRETQLRLEPLQLDTNDKHYEYQGSTLVLSYPFTGGYDNVHPYFPDVQPMMRTYGEKRNLEVHLHIDSTPAGQMAEAAMNSVAWVDRYINQQIGVINKDIQHHRQIFETELKALLRPRWERARALREAMQGLNIPLGEAKKGSINIPLQPTELSMVSIQKSAAKNTSEWQLAEQMAEALVETIASFSRALERLPKTASSWLDQDEEALRDLLLFVLNANFKGHVTGETFIGEGKSDILLRWKDRDAFVGECKIWRGPKTVSDGLDQLLDRYTLWRHSHIALIVFIKDTRDASKAIASAYQEILEHRRTTRALDGREQSERSDFEVLASGDENKPTRLSFLPVVIPDS